MGGSFNPIHHGHLIVARAVAEHLGLERLTLVPALGAPHKLLVEDGPQVCLPTPQQRLEMIRLAIAGDELFELSEIELRRRPPSYTIDTLHELRQTHGAEARLYWIVGADMLADLPNWHRADEVVEAATIVTAARPPWTRRMPEILARLRTRFSPQQVDRLAAAVAPTPLVEITSTQIRHRLRLGQSVRYLTPPGVVDFMARAGLYRPATGATETP